jgi:hypothetical protein
MKGEPDTTPEEILSMVKSIASPHPPSPLVPPAEQRRMEIFAMAGYYQRERDRSLVQAHDDRRL